MVAFLEDLLNVGNLLKNEVFFLYPMRKEGLTQGARSLEAIDSLVSTDVIDNWGCNFLRFLGGTLRSDMSPLSGLYFF